jgi:hypothetical protein
MMKSQLVILLFLVLANSHTLAQRNADWGVIGGASVYLGEINPDDLFYQPSPGGGLFYRYNFHPRHSLRASVMVLGIRGDDSVSDIPVNVDRGAAFSGSVGEFATQFEFNFFPYTTEGVSKKLRYTPYMAAGLGISFINSAVFTYTPVIPFAAGIKVNLRKNIGLEFEYGFRKTFYDNFDGQTDPVDPDHRTWTHNNDWYSFAGVAFTWKMYSRLAGCPAYDEQTKKGRRR